MLEHPLVALKFFLLAVGDVVGKPITDGPSGYEVTLVMLLGLAIILMAVGTVFICGIRRDKYSAAPVGIALICYGVLFAAMITQGRLIFPLLSAASFSRYTTFDLLILVGIFLAVLDRPSRVRSDVAPDTTSGQATTGSVLAEQVGSRTGRRWDRVALVPFVRVAVVIAIAVQIPVGVYYGIRGARVNHAQFVEAAATLRNIDHVPNSGLTSPLLVFKSGAFIRQQAHTLQQHHLSVFADG